MNPFSLEVLRDLGEAFGEGEDRFLLLGPDFTDLALRQAGGFPREERKAGPAELDMVLAAGGWEEVEQAVKALTEGDFERTDREEILRHANGSTLFLWPCGDRVAPADRLVWPRSGTEYSTAGLTLARARALPAAVGDDLEVFLPPLPVLLLVKIVFYLGRMSSRDLAEIVACLAGAPAGGRKSSAGAYRLGVELRTNIPETYHPIPRNFLSEVEAVHAPMISRMFRRRGEVDPAEGERMEGLFSLFHAFRCGFGSG